VSSVFVPSMSSTTTLPADVQILALVEDPAQLVPGVLDHLPALE
jgi:hypothetical protein